MSLLTKRIPTILGIVFLMAIVAGGYYYLQMTKPKVATVIIPKNVRITNVADNKFSVSWVSGVETKGIVEYGQVGEKLTSRAKDDRDKDTQGAYLTHHVTVEGLQPSTQYAFRILSGEELVRFDNNGSPYTVGTGPVIGATPASQNFYGDVAKPSSGAIVYLTLPSSATVSTLVNEAGNYAFTLSTIRSNDLRSYIKYDPAATVGSLSIESGKQQSTSAISLANSAPVPTITLGKNVDFMNPTLTPEVAQVEPQIEPQIEPQASPSMSPEVPTIFNVEPLSEDSDINVISAGSLTLLNPKDEGETLMTLRPEFRGTAPANSTLSISIKGQKAVSDTTQAESDGTWSWAPVIDLKVGKQSVSVSTIGTGGETLKVERGFTISLSASGVDPAFVSTPSASTNASVAPSPSSRTTMPATDSGVPITGVIENTLLTLASGIVIMIVGAMLFAL